MTPNLTELMQRVEDERSRSNEELARGGVLHWRPICERSASDALLARLLSVIRCPECGGTGTKRLAIPVDISGTGDRPIMRTREDCPTCGPDRAAIERMK